MAKVHELVSIRSISPTVLEEMRAKFGVSPAGRVYLGLQHCRTCADTTWHVLYDETHAVCDWAPQAVEVVAHG